MNNVSYKKIEPEIINLKGWIQLVDEQELHAVFDDAIREAGFSVLNYNSHQFPVSGFTAFWLLAESHLAIHTFVDRGVCYIELSSCNREKTMFFKRLCDKMNYDFSWDGDIEISSPQFKPEYSL